MKSQATPKELAWLDLGGKMGWQECGRGHKSILVPMTCWVTIRSRPQWLALIILRYLRRGAFQSKDGYLHSEVLLILALTENTQCCPVPNNLEASKHPGVGVGKHLSHTVPQSLGQLLLTSVHDYNAPWQRFLWDKGKGTTCLVQIQPVSAISATLLWDSEVRS